MTKKLEIIFRPLEGWPRPLMTVRKQSPFRSHTLAENLNLLKDELRELNSTVVILQTAHEEDDISSLSGLPLDGRRVKHPGVIVAADTKYGSLKWVCDDCEKWIDNIRAIALTLERLRLAGRYGVTHRGEQYLGWKMLPGPITAAADDAHGMTVEQAAAFVGQISGAAAAKIIESRGWFEQAFRDASKKLHPDKGGSPDQWRKLQDAKTLLDSLHNRK